MKGLDGKTAIVSGGATLIGASCASVLAGYGVNVVIADINEADGKQAAKDIGAKAAFIRADITSDDDIAALVAATVKRMAASTSWSTSPAPISTTARTRRAPTG